MDSVYSPDNRKQTAPAKGTMPALPLAISKSLAAINRIFRI
jgi:hypothetical protein